MKNPLQLQSDALARSMRRDTMVGTAVLLLIESGLIGVAAAMVGLNAEADQLEQRNDDEQSARKARPIADPQPLPDMQLAMTANIGSVPPERSDDLDPPSVDFTRIGSSGLHRPREISDATGVFADIGSVEFGQASGRIGHGVVQPPSRAGVSGGWVVSDSEPADGEGSSSSPSAGHDPQAGGVLVGTDDADVIRGMDGNDYIFGLDGPDLLLGGLGNDRLLAGKGDDVLSGGAGNDVLVGDKGDDQMTGGAGADTFLFRAGFGHDVVTDFKGNGEHDVIAMSKSEFADFAALSHNLTASELGVVLTLHDGSTLTLSHVTLAGLTANDFRFEV